MVKTKVVILLFFLMLLFSSAVLNAQHDLPQDATLICREIISRQMEIDNFQVEAHLEVNFSKQQKSVFDFIYYFQEPGMVHLETKDFILLPTDTLRTLQPEFFKPGDYQLEFVREEAGMYIFALIPLDPVQQYKIILIIDPDRKMIKHAEILVKIANLENDFSIKIDYEKISGYSLPTIVIGDLAIPTKFTYEWKIKDFREGNFYLKMKNYKINQGIPARILKKMQQQSK